MKRFLICALLMAITSVYAMAEEKKGQAEKSTAAAKVAKPDVNAAAARQEQIMKDALAKRKSAVQENHDKMIARWQDIRKTAVEEKATKTAAAIDQLIAEEQESFKKRMELGTGRFGGLPSRRPGTVPAGKPAPKAAPAEKP